MDQSPLKKGAEGSMVQQLHDSLNRLGYLTPLSAEEYTDLTICSIKAFQGHRGIAADGIAGPVTQQELQLALQEVQGSTLTAASLPVELPKQAPTLLQPLPDLEIQNTRPTIQQGSSGTYVAQLQNALKTMGYFSSDVTSYFGSVTDNAVKKFQKAHYLTADGRVGPATWARLDSSLSLFQNMPAVSARPVISNGSRGDYVAYLQKRLRELGYLDSYADGIFGSATENAVRTFQAARGLTADGYVGVNTWKALEGNTGDGSGNGSGGGGTSSTNPILMEGSTGTYVSILQGMLKELGYFAASIDGSFGPITRNAVIAFQAANGLSADGIVGPLTWDKLYDLTNTQTELPSDGSRPVLRLGDSGEYVRELQQDLKALLYYTGTINSQFDQPTQTAVKAFQATNNLTADGVVGQRTWNALISLQPPPVQC